MTTLKRKIFRALLKVLKWLLLGMLIVFVALAAWVILVMGDLRVFVPQYFKIAGYPGVEKNYLVVFQNNNELRPAGGFITAVGIVKFRSGIFVGLEIKDVYGATDKHDYIEPPYPLNEFLDKEGKKISYSFRDANFYPDFGDSAKSLKQMFKLADDELKIDGIFAVNYSFLEDLLAKIGPLEVDGVIFDKDSLFINLEYLVNSIDRHNLEDLKNRKNILGDFSGELIRKIVLNPYLIKYVIEVAEESLRKKDIQLYFEDESLEKIAELNGWSGKWPEVSDGDFLAFNEANLGGLKSDRYISREVNYFVKIEENAKALVTVKMKHFGLENVPISSDYEGYLRLYVPKKTRITMTDTSKLEKLSQHNEEKLRVLEGMIKLAPGEEKTFSYEYDLPDSVVRGDKYSLYIPKQSGTKNDLYTVIIQLPNGYEIKSDTFEARENFAVYRGEPEQDLDLSFTFKKSKLAPYVIYQNIDSLGRVRVSFNEDVADLETANFEIIDTDEKVANWADVIKVVSIEQDGQSAILNIDGMTAQNEERYSLKVKDVKDLDGNIIDPNPRVVTLVQRL